MSESKTTRKKIAIALFAIPIVLAFLSWAYFPSVSQFVITNVFGYSAREEAASVLWRALIGFFYSWYTFLAIGAGGVWIVAAFLARKKSLGKKVDFYPLVSFVVPGYNEEENVKRCIASLTKCAEEYLGSCEIIVVDDGSTDLTYESALLTARGIRASHPRISCRVSRHMVNLGKTEALKTGVNKALGQVVAVVDADSEWTPSALRSLIDDLLSNGKKAITGYIHPRTEDGKNGLFVALQRLEYSQGLAIDRCGQSLGNLVLVVPGAIGVYDAHLFRDIVTDVKLRSVTEDSEITLEMHKRGARIGYLSSAVSGTNVPTAFKSLWRQRLRWFTGWLHNLFGIHSDLLRRRSWLSALLWYSLVFESGGAFVDLAAILAFPFLFWFAPDRLNFMFNLVVFAVYGLLINIVSQAVALKFAYGKANYGGLLWYAPLFPVLWVVNVFARLWSVFGYVFGKRGKWHIAE